MLVTLYKIGKVHFRLFFGTNGFHVKAENERFTTAGWQKISRRHLADYVSKMHRKACSSIIPHSTNQIIDFLCCRSRYCRRFLNSLVSFWCTVESHMHSGHAFFLSLGYLVSSDEPKVILNSCAILIHCTLSL